jgi:hypothetical protein
MLSFEDSDSRCKSYSHVQQGEAGQKQQKNTYINDDVSAEALSQSPSGDNLFKNIIV